MNTFLRKFCIYTIACLSSIFTLDSSESASIHLNYNPENGCVANITGRLEEGDFEKALKYLVDESNSNGGYYDTYSSLALAQVPDLQRYRTNRICLDSEGGSFAEALKIAELVHLNYGTVIPSGAKCLSACALVFMSGSVSGEEGMTLVDRHMHASARLGLHAPSLDLQEIVTPALVAAAYATAIADVADIVNKQEILGMQRSLMGWMLRTAPDQMLLIDTVGKASRWHINVYGSLTPPELTAVEFENACKAAVMSISPVDDQFGTNLDRYGIDSAFINTDSDDTFEVARVDGRILGRRYGYLGEAASTCVVSIKEQSLGDIQRITQGSDFVRINQNSDYVYFEGEDISVPIEAFMLYGPLTPLHDTIHAHEGASNIMNNRRPQNTIGICRVITAGKLSDMERCRRIIRDEPGKLIEFYIWPSGSKTVIEVERNRVTINGNSGTNTKNNDKFSNFGHCVVNDSTLNTFCFSNN